MNIISMIIVILMLIITAIAAIPMMGMEPITYGIPPYTVSLTPGIVVIILSTLYLVFILITILIAQSISKHSERSISGLAQKLADCQYEKNKLVDENRQLINAKQDLEKKVQELEEELKNLREMYNKQLAVIERLTQNNEEEKTETSEKSEKHSTDQPDGTEQ
ncbi:MAG: hypothetical protein GXO59_00715 [Dictyoglomi bacterium]|nr:hypothetical protein [Dictyoglomota bacterium]